MTTPFDLLRERRIPFLIDVDRRIDPGSMPVAAAFINEAIELAEDHQPGIERTYGLVSPVKFIRIEGKGTLYCAVAGNANLEKMRMTYRIRGVSESNRVLTLDMPYPNNGDMKPEQLHKAVSDILTCSASALRTMASIDIAESSRTFRQIMDAYAVYASSTLPRSPTPYASTIYLRTPFERAMASFEATDEEFDVLAAIGPCLTVDMLSHNPENGSVSMSLKRTQWTSAANGPHSGMDRMASYAILHGETMLGQTPKAAS